MLRLFSKLFIYPFYRSNAGFFLFFFFFFFGVVNAGTLVSYHQSLMLSFLNSPVLLTGVMVFWTLYHFKCTSYCMQTINSQQGAFLYNLQTIPPKKQILWFLFLHLMIYAPVLLYAIVVMVFGWTKGFYSSVVSIGTFQLIICFIGAYIYYRRINSWPGIKNSFSFHFLHKKPKPFILVLIYYFLFEKKVLFLLLKTLSLILLYVALVLNRDGYDNDHFIFFYLMILMLHSIFSYLTFQFLEKRLSFYRNLPMRLIRYAGVYFITYLILFLPELFYLLLNARELMPATTIAAYYGITISSLCLMTGVQYSENMSKKEYVKFVFALVFVSTFVLHAHAFWFWIIIQFIMAVILFRSGFYKYETTEL